MKKILFTPFVLLSLVPAFAAEPVGSNAVAPPPANVAGNATDSSSVPAEPDRIVVPLRTLTVVKDARERRQSWQQAADQAEARITDPALKSNVTAQLSTLTPQVAKLLMQQSGESAIVTVAVYKEHDHDRQVLAAVAFEGVGESLNPSFYARVLANMSQVPGADAQFVQRLELDPIATSYLCFFIDHGDLKADDITHAQMKKSLDLGIQEARKAGDVVPGSPAADALAQRELADRQRQAALNQEQYDAAQQASSQTSPDWTTSYWDSGSDAEPYYGADGWIPWVAYLPATGQQPVVVRPDFHHREQWEKNARDVHERAIAAEKRAAEVRQHQGETPATVKRPEQPAEENNRPPVPVAPRDPSGAPAPSNGGQILLPRQPEPPQLHVPGPNEAAREQRAARESSAPAREELAPAPAARHRAPAPAPGAPARAPSAAPTPVAQPAAAPATPTPARK